MKICGMLSQSLFIIILIKEFFLSFGVFFFFFGFIFSLLRYYCMTDLVPKQNTAMAHTPIPDEKIIV
jgi:hypothetical protein